MSEIPKRVIAIGGSAGGLDAAVRLLSALESDLSASVFLVLHSGNIPIPAMKTKLSKAGPLPVEFAEDGDTIKSGHVYLSPPGHHMLIQESRVRVTYGPRVNRSRPAIDLLFRSAAVAYGSRTVGVLLSGMLNDGVVGLQAVRRSGGIVVVQDPAEAEYPDLPENAVSQMEIDHIEPVSSIGTVLNRFAKSPAGPAQKIPADIALENRMDLKIVDEDNPSKMDQLGTRVSFSCPDCGGQLWEINGNGSEIPRFRCHTGHSMDIESLLKGQDEEIEKILWVALRTLEEKAQLQDKIAQSREESGKKMITESARERAAETKSYVQRLRNLLMGINEK